MSEGQGVDQKKRRRTVYFALISLIANLTHEQRNAFLPIHSNVHGIIVVAEEARKCCG